MYNKNLSHRHHQCEDLADKTEGNENEIENRVIRIINCLIIKINRIDSMGKNPSKMFIPTKRPFFALQSMRLFHSISFLSQFVFHLFFIK